MLVCFSLLPFDQKVSSNKISKLRHPCVRVQVWNLDSIPSTQPGWAAVQMSGVLLIQTSIPGNVICHFRLTQICLRVFDTEITEFDEGTSFS